MVASARASRRGQGAREPAPRLSPKLRVPNAYNPNLSSLNLAHIEARNGAILVLMGPDDKVRAMGDSEPESLQSTTQAPRQPAGRTSADGTDTDDDSFEPFVPSPGVTASADKSYGAWRAESFGLVKRVSQHDTVQVFSAHYSKPRYRLRTNEPILRLLCPAQPRLLRPARTTVWTASSRKFRVGQTRRRGGKR